MYSVCTHTHAQSSVVSARYSYYTINAKNGNAVLNNENILCITLTQLLFP